MIVEEKNKHDSISKKEVNVSINENELGKQHLKSDELIFGKKPLKRIKKN